MKRTPEHERLEEARTGTPWRRWGPYLSERQWGTVREDYSDGGDAWSYFTHDQARSRAYRWGEDGILGISDDQQRLCFALALWNGRDPILKERLFGLSNGEGNHGEDVKEYYYYLDSTPTHAYMKGLYKYPQRAFPYADLVRTNARRSRRELEYELIDTGVFDDDAYFDVVVEYAKDGPDELLVRITAHNRGTAAAPLHLLPTLWFRNTWSWTQDAPRPELTRVDGPPGTTCVHAHEPALGNRLLLCEGTPALLFTENETNAERLFGRPNRTPYVKDGIDEAVVHGRTGAVSPTPIGTKVAAHWVLDVPAGGSAAVRLRLSNRAPAAWRRGDEPFGPAFDLTLERRHAEADAFYEAITPDHLDPDAARVMRQALAGMFWSKQYYFYDVEQWLTERGAGPHAPPGARMQRNRHWYHMLNSDVVSMPDKWEYPWYAVWDLAFHAIALGMADPDFAKDQLELVLRDRYLHPNGQIPAYEWNFGDVNPPVHAWATHFLYTAERALTGSGDREFLQRSFHKLALNFTWWVNQKDREGRNVFEGGFLGLDNIGVFDRSAPLPTGGRLEQADGTAWMAFFSQCMLQIALELAAHDPRSHEDMAVKFFDHFLWIASAMDRVGDHHDEMWDEADGFYYDVLRLPDGSAHRLKVRSFVGLLPLCASTVIEPHVLERVPELRARLAALVDDRRELLRTIAPPDRPGVAGRRLLSVVDERKLRRLLATMLDEREFLSPYGIRSLSRYHADHPYVVHVGGSEYRVAYQPAESDSGLFGGNSNWRGPVWMPVNVLLIRALLNLHVYYGDAFTVECPTGSGNHVTLFGVAKEIADRTARAFLRGPDGRRPVFGGARKFQDDPHWRDHLLFYEYFHGDVGAGLGASHQTGWTGLVAKLIQLFAAVSPERILADTTTGVIAYHE